MLLGKVIAGCLGIGLVLWLIVGAFRQVHFGSAVVVASGVLNIEGQEYSLWAVTVPEVTKTCPSTRGAWPCGAYATAALLLQVTEKSVMCFGKGEGAGGIQPAKCYASRNVLMWKDVARELVKLGWLKPDPTVSREYGPMSHLAIGYSVGIWSK